MSKGESARLKLWGVVCGKSIERLLQQIQAITGSKINVFDGSIQDSEEYRAIHKEYKCLIDKLLQAFQEDSGLSHDQIIQALHNMNAKTDIREIFQSLLEQVLASEDYQLFVQLMIQKNNELQLQVIMMIVKARGDLPDSLKKETETKIVDENEGEDAILRAVLSQSKSDYEEELKQNKEAEKQYNAIILISKEASSKLKQEVDKEREKVNERIQTLAINDEPPISKELPGLQQKSLQKSQPVVPQPQSQISSKTTKPTSSAQFLDSGISGREAASNWLTSAHREASHNVSAKTMEAMSATIHNLGEEEMKKRFEFLKEQRDKLVEMKRKERSKTLQTAEKSYPKRPSSARVAKEAMRLSHAPEKKNINPDDEKKLAMRRAIASRIKSEVIGEK